MASEIPFWQSSPLVWDQLKLNGKVVPGRAKVTPKLADTMDVRKPPKMNRAVLVDQGQAPIEGEVEIVIGFESAPGSPFGTAQEQWTAWQQLESDLFGRKPKSRQALAVSHPQFARYGISRVWLMFPSLEVDGPGTGLIRMHWYEHGKVFPAEAGAVTAGPIRPIGTTDIRTLANAPKPSADTTSAGTGP